MPPLPTDPITLIANIGYARKDLPKAKGYRFDQQRYYWWKHIPLTGLTDAFMSARDAGFTFYATPGFELPAERERPDIPNLTYLIDLGHPGDMTHDSRREDFDAMGIGRSKNYNWQYYVTVYAPFADLLQAQLAAISQAHPNETPMTWHISPQTITHANAWRCAL